MVPRSHSGIQSSPDPVANLEARTRSRPTGLKTATQALLAAIPVPDLEMRHKEIEVIKGELTSPINPKPGCRFAARCPYACESCMGKDPELVEVSPGHFVACHRAEELELRGFSYE